MKNSEWFKRAIDKGMTMAHTDIETSPNLVWTYPLRKTDISHKQIEVPSQVTSIGWMFEDEQKIFVRGWDDSKNKHGVFDLLRADRDKELLRTTVPILNEADILIGQNSISFDEPTIRWRLSVHKLPALNFVIPVDMLRENQKVYKAPSLKLDYLSNLYQLGGKIDQDMSDCINTAKGHKPTQKIRMKYNAKDVEDQAHVFWRNVDYWRPPVAVIKTLKMYVEADECTFCIMCAAKRQAKFNIQRNRSKTGIKMTCRNCDHTWKIQGE